MTTPSITNFTNSSSGSDYIYLEWAKPNSDGNSIIESYTLQYKLHNDVNWTNIFMANKGLLLDDNITQLNGSTEYIFRISSFNDYFTSNWSKIYHVTTKSATIPFAPFSPFAIDIKKNPKRTIDFTIAFKANSNVNSVKHIIVTD